MNLASLKLSNIFRRLATSLPQRLEIIRNSSYHSSQFLEDIGDPTVKYEITNDPADWKYVEQALPPVLVPKPVKKEHYPSGWTPQAENLDNKPYFIARTKNHMLPVYLKIKQKGTRRHTMIRKISGDIFLLEKELKKFLQKESFHPIRSQANEFVGYIRMNGDFVNACKYWLEKRNF